MCRLPNGNCSPLFDFMAAGKPRPRRFFASSPGEDCAISIGTRYRIMTARLLWFSLFLLALSALLPPCAFAADPSPSAAIAEPPGPKASADVEKLLQEANRLADAKQPADSL